MRSPAPPLPRSPKLFEHEILVASTVSAALRQHTPDLTWFGSELRLVLG